jgi:hypothetical protein
LTANPSRPEVEVLLLPGPVETPLSGIASRPPVFAIACTTVLAVAFLLPRLAVGLASQGLAEPVVRTLGLMEATWTLYPDSELFQPWQLWTWVLVGSSWWLWAGSCLLFAALSAAVERRAGPVMLMAILAALAPLGAGVHLIAAGAASRPVQVGAGMLVVGLAGFAAVLLHPARLSIGFGWWAVVVAGWIPVGRVALPWVGIAWAFCEGLVAGPVAGIADLVALAAGTGLGWAMRRRLP